MSPEPGTITVDRLWKRFRADPTAGALGRLRWATQRWRPGATAHWRWALRDVSLRVGVGEAVGVVGVNGSGKSTMLKILTGTMDPTAGRVEVAGRVGALIELQAGLHPELTGRENVLAYGALLGLSRRQAAAGVDQVVEFAGVGEAVDRQVKFFSTGMSLRLGFAIATHLDAPVLLVDEVLAVADAEFQAEGLGRIRALNAEGATVVVVSHDLSVIERTCERVVWIDRGRLVADGPTDGVLADYRAASLAPEREPAAAAVVVGPVSVVGADGEVPRSGAGLAVRLDLECAKAATGTLRVGIGIGDDDPVLVVEREQAVAAGSSAATCRLASLPLAGGSYRLWTGFETGGGAPWGWQSQGEFEVHGPRPGLSGLPLALGTSWEFAPR